MMKILLICAVLSSAIAFFVIQNKKTENVHLHAGFQVYINNELQDFSDFKYMNFKSCGEHEESLTPEEEQIEKAHLHDFVGDVVHVHRKGATWGDIFKNLNVELSPTEVYVNGEKYEGDFFNYEIAHYDSVIILQGEYNDIEEKLDAKVSKDHILEVEKKSEYCAS